MVASIQLGATFGNTGIGTDFITIRDIAQAVEGIGFDNLATNDHVVGGHPDRAGDEKMHTSQTAVHEPLVLLSFIGAVTTNLGLVTSVLLLPQRQTTLVAKQVAELDLLSNGRVRLGVGIGRNWMEYEALNENFKNRGKRIEEQIEVLRRYWTEEHVTFEGTWHSLDRVGLNPMPIQRPIPIWMGSFFGFVAEPAIERIGRMADGWMPQFPPDKLAPVLERVRGYARDAGRDPSELAIECVVPVAAGQNPDEWIERARAYVELGATHLKVMANPSDFTTPQARLDAMTTWYETVAPAVR